MSILVSDVITGARDRLNESSTTFFTEAVMIKAVDQAQRFAVWNNTPLEEVSTSTIDTSADDPEQYTIPTDCLNIIRITLDGIDLFRTTFQQIKDNQIDTDTSSGQPTHFWEWKDVLNLYPVPQTNGQTLKIWYYQNCAKITAIDDTLEVPDYYEDALIPYVMYICLLRDRKKETADFQMTEAVGKLRELRNISHKNKARGTDTPVFQRSTNINRRGGIVRAGIRRLR